MSVLDAAHAARAAGLCVLPVAADGSKRPAVSTWKQFQSAPPTDTEFASFNFAQRAGLGVVSGPVSGFREAWDFDCLDAYDQFVHAAKACGLEDVVQRISTGFESATPNGGRRWLVGYPREVVWQDVTLARRVGRDGEPAVKTLIEMPTFAIVAPSHGQTHPSGRAYVLLSGDFAHIASYSQGERRDLFALARTFDQMPRRVAAVRRPTTSALGTRPGDDYARRTSWGEILQPFGWAPVYDRAETSYWRRPGKDVGVSGTTNYGGADLFVVFTSSTEFDPAQSYSKFATYSMLKHGGDFGRAAAALAALGFGHSGQPPSMPAAMLSASGCTLAAADGVFRRWLGDEYDFDVLHVVLATAAAEHLTGDPLWLLVVGGPGAAKTETVQALGGSGALVTSTISSEGALLSATAKKDHTKGATGGLLRRIGNTGVLVLKDVTSLLSMNRDGRAAVLAALREIYDGRWERNVGTDGGKSLLWTGRIALVGAVTTAWDKAHNVTSSMGDRFVLVRMDSTTGRHAAGRQACRNTGSELQMRGDLAAAVGSVLASMDASVEITITTDEQERLLRAADVVTLARTGVEYDYRGEVVDAHAPEMPTRFAKQLMQLMRGALAIGMNRQVALRLAIRCGRDSMPPLRLAILDDVAAHPGSTTHDVRIRLDKPRATIDRQLQALHILRVLRCDAEDGTHAGRAVQLWHYSLAENINPDVLAPDSVPDLFLHPHGHKKDMDDALEQPRRQRVPSNISGTDPADRPLSASDEVNATEDDGYRNPFAH